MGTAILGRYTLMGPIGHGGMAAADAVDASLRLGGRPVLALRMSEGDARGRHQGVSHHSEAVLSLCSNALVAAWPKDCPFERPPFGSYVEVDVTEHRYIGAVSPFI